MTRTVVATSGKAQGDPTNAFHILNACLRSTARRVAARVRSSLCKAGVPRSARLYFTCNDGSAVSFAQAVQSPLRCVQCGPTNSLRGAAYLVSSHDNNNNNNNNNPMSSTTVTIAGCAVDRIVLDIGGTSTDAGCLVGGTHPRDSNAEAYIAGVRCNHRTTDVVSIALGGGSIVSESENGEIQIGPESVGADITTAALCFGGAVCTATCIAVAMGASVSWSQEEEEEETQLAKCSFNVPSFAPKAWDAIQKCFYELVERTRADSSPVEVVLVGGGAGLVDSERLSEALDGCRIVRPHHASVANACGSALAQNVGEAQTIADLSATSRESVLAKLKGKARKAAGPKAQVVECEEVPLAYLPGKMTRVFVRAVAPLDITKHVENADDEINVEDPELFDEKSAPRLLAPTRADPHRVVPSPRNVKDGVWTISQYDAHCLAIGCGILGCGGGGSTYHGKLQLLAALREGRPIRVVSVEDIPPDAVVAPCGFMGAPSVSLETIGGADQVAAAVLHAFELKSLNPSDPKAYISISEIGGGNGIMPLLVGGLMDLPVVDTDLMGRAFPELQMTTASIYGLPQSPMTVSDSFGRCVTINSSSEASTGLVAADDSYWTERVLRPVCVEFGCSAGLADPLVTGSELRRVGVRGSLSRARRIGDCLLRSNHPGEAMKRILEQEGGKCIFRGMVSDVTRETTKGFAVGTLTIAAEDKGCSMIIQFQNEFLIARRTEPECSPVVEGCVPDIISCLDVDTARPIATEEVRFGLRVCVILLPVSSLLRTEKALNVVGPRPFGLEESYKSSLYDEERTEHR